MAHIFYRMNFAFTLWLLVASLFLLTGCATPRPGAPAPPSVPEAKAEAFLHAGDVVNVKFLYWPELDEEQAVRPDGKLSLALVGDVPAEGMTPDGLRTELLDLYKDKLKEPEINVVVRSFQSQRVYVGGEVKSPGLLPLQGRLTVLQAIVQAGGVLNESAKVSNIIVIRQQDGKPRNYSLDLRASLSGAEPAPFYLEPYDIVYVPRTVIDRLDQWVDKHLNKLVPRNLSYSFNDVVNNGGSKSYNSPVQIQLPSLRN